jgi:hypothetical protein
VVQTPESRTLVRRKLRARREDPELVVVLLVFLTGLYDCAAAAEL